MLNKKKIYLFVFILILFSADRISKILILKNFSNNSLSEIYFNSFLNFSLVWNSGIGFGILQIEPNIFYSIMIFSTLFAVTANVDYLIRVLKGNIQKAGIFAHEEFARLEFAYA